ncbi:MAG: efflux RND transporter periplasmic adaptor subunit [Phycisphaerales bacterium]
MIIRRFVRGAFMAAAAGAVACTLTGCDLLGKKTPPPPPPPPPEVEVTPVIQRDVALTGEWLGTLDGLVNAEVRSRVQGYLQSQAYLEGEKVKVGDPLYQVDPRPFDAALAQAKADLARAKANLVRTQLDVARLEPLAPSGAVSQQDVDNARQNNQANEAQVLAAEAVVQEAELNLQYTKILAPVDGVAGISKAQVGDLVGGVAGPVLTTISTLDPIRAYFPISEQEYLRFAERLNRTENPKDQKKEPIQLILGDGALYAHTGEVDIVNRQVDPTTGTIKIAAKFPNPGNILRPGQYARVRAVVDRKKDALLVPQRAISELQGRQQVAVVGADNKVAIRQVITGRRDGSDWIIEKGVVLGDRVVVEGIQKVRDGMTVNAKPWTPPAPPKAAANTPAPTQSPTPAAAPAKAE